MKWSEQMRVLNSEDEHYNQLVLDTATGRLFINDELIDVLEGGSINGTPSRTLEHYKFKEILKKYPFFTDVKFLLNCVFVEENARFTHYSRPSNLTKYKSSYEIVSADTNTILQIYFKKPELE